MNRTVIYTALLTAVIFVLTALSDPYIGGNVSGTDQASVAIDNETAYDMTESCVISASKSWTGYSPGTGDIHDGRTDTYMRLQKYGAPYWQVNMRSSRAQGVYIEWEYPPGAWTLEADGDGGTLSSIECGGGGYIQEYVPLPEGTVSFRIVQHRDCERPLSMLELSVWSEGVLPGRVHIWDPTPSRCELMLVSAHQDDELLFFGGTIPYYAAEKRLDTVVAYMANCGSERMHEALNGLWVCGMRRYPLFLMLPDVKSLSLKAARRTWDEEEVTDMLAGLFLQYQPQVVLTHDIDGEYGHGQHMLTAVCVQSALERCADSAEAQRLLPGSEPYEVPKCYLHLWSKNQIYMDWRGLSAEPLGMTAAEAAAEGYKEHKSQHSYFEEIFLGGPYDCCLFGLYRSSVGPDEQKNDMFENLTPRVISPDTAPSPPGDGFVPVLHSGFVWRGGDGGETVYIRYGTIDGKYDWYLCDSTGALLYEGGRAQPYKRNIVQALDELIVSGPAEENGAQDAPLCPAPEQHSSFAGLPPGIWAAGGLFAAALLVILIIIIRAVSKRSGPRKTQR